MTKGLSLLHKYMSARAPFFPSGARPESRAAGDQQECNAGQLLADNPNTHQDALTDTLKENDADSKLPTENDAKDTQYKPLNVNGLIRSRTHSKPPQRVLINGGNISRPGTTDPDTFSAHTKTIAAPTPFKASRMAPPLLMSMSNATLSSGSIPPFNFKTPSMHTHGENNAHIPSETYSSSHGVDGPVQIRSVNSFNGRNIPPDDKNVEDSSHGFTVQQNVGGKRRKDEMETSGQTDQHQKHLKRFKGGNSLRRDASVMMRTQRSTLSDLI